MIPALEAVDFALSKLLVLHLRSIPMSRKTQQKPSVDGVWDISFLLVLIEMVRFVKCYELLLS